MVEITEETIKGQTKVVFDFGLELHKVESQVLNIGLEYKEQIKAAQDNEMLRVKYFEEVAVLRKMQNLLAEYNAKSRTLDLVIPNKE